MNFYEKNVQKLLALKISSFEGIFRAKRVAQCVGGIKMKS